MRWLRFGWIWSAFQAQSEAKSTLPSLARLSWCDISTPGWAKVHLGAWGSSSGGPVVEVSKYILLICPVDQAKGVRSWLNKLNMKVPETHLTWKFLSESTLSWFSFDADQLQRCSTTPTRMPTICQRRTEMIAGGHMWLTCGPQKHDVILKR